MIRDSLFYLLAATISLHPCMDAYSRRIDRNTDQAEIRLVQLQKQFEIRSDARNDVMKAHNLGITGF